MRREGLADWWRAGGNLLLTAPGAPLPVLRANGYLGAPRGAVVVVGEGAVAPHFDLSGEAPLLAVGREANLHAAVLVGVGPCTLLIGDGVTATSSAHLDARNGGLILVGADGMWAHDILIMTDDAHAIREVETGRRVNGRGGVIVVGRHVWLAEQVRVLAGARIGGGSVVGAGALVKGSALPANAVSVGRPARPVRTGVTWTRDDLP